jgi:hypothetical protein
MKTVFTFFICILLSAAVYSQHRGDRLSFQGVNLDNDYSVTSLGMGNAFTSLSGDVSAVFSNPAGLTGINNLQVTVGGSNVSRYWRENQDYRPDRFFVTLPFYLEGLYVPDPANNGEWDHVVAGDSLPYNVNLPRLGLDPFSKEAADWEKDLTESLFNNIAIAYPFYFYNTQFVVSAAYNRSLIWDYDRNDTYLDPHPGYDLYGKVSRVNGLDTVVLQWSKYLRNRTGFMNNIFAAFAVNLHENVKIGVGGKYIWGNSDDLLSLNRVGSFDLIRENRFRFYYQNNTFNQTGTSDFSGMQMNAGLIINLNKLKIGFNADLPYTLKREWSLVETVGDSAAISNNISGIDEADIPASFTLGISLSPVDDLIVSFDLKKTSYSSTEFKLASADTLFRGWSDQNIIRFGAQYKAGKILTLRAGYRNIPELFIPDGAAFNDEGPVAESFTGGLSLSFFFGRFDFAYEYRRMKYYDSYYSNTNYVLESASRFMAGFSYNL